jgi:hypothetical protein
MTDRNKLYRTPSGEIVTGAELVEVPRTAEEVIRAAVETINGWYAKPNQAQVTQHIFTALREADMLKEPDDGWIKHDGGPCPVDGDVQVDLIVDESDRVVRGADARTWSNWPGVKHYHVVGGLNDD